ncbi:MAG TPA: sigma-70 family RNA polymerase sigma factor [Candidatus Dormibacteraeota bacterium]|nr:sigma-70 family RNA polymerase sigma factor [Candidatus Dormibacteraeota bacterium]
MSDVTAILSAIDQGDPKAANELLPLVYQELRKLAAAKMASEIPGNTLQPTALVHEAYLRLVGDPGKKWDGRAHFFGAAAEAMRRILIDSARRKHAVRHGGDVQRVDIEGLEIAGGTPPEELIEVNEALEKFSTQDPQKAELVKLRYFAGMTIEEAADVMSISPATAKRWWTFSRAWLYQEMGRGEP